jgi:hypothetical protein
MWKNTAWTFEERGVSELDRRLDWMVDASRRMDDVPPRGALEVEEWEAIRYTAARSICRERWHLRERSRRRTWESVRKAAHGRFPVEGWSEEVQTLARKLIASDPRGLDQDLQRLDRCDQPAFWQAFWPLEYAAGVLLRDAGELEAAYRIFGRTYTGWAWHNTAPFDERYPPLPAGWRHGVPVLMSWRGRLEWRPGIPRVEFIHWGQWDHVIGCGTQIDRRLLDALGVPAAKQIAIEVHRHVPFGAGQLPRLKGRVVVLDDVHEGETSQTFARLYNADVVDVGHGLTCTRILAGILPVYELYNEVTRARFGGRE